METDAFKLSDFQRLMRRWTKLAPYNAIHVLHVAGSPDAAAWRAAIDETLAEAGLGIPCAGDAVIRFAPGGPCEIGAGGRLDETIERELNRGFGPHEMPLRFTVVAAQDEPHHHLVVTFDHWLADSHSIRALMQRMHARCTGAAPLQALTSGSPASSPFAPFTLLRTWIGSRNARRLAVSDPLNFETAFLRFVAPPGVIDDVRAAAGRLGATTNDAFLAALAQACEASLPPAPGRRRGIGLATAVDLRRFLPAPRVDEFGFHLGHFNVVLDKPGAFSLPHLIRIIARRTGPLKNSRAAVRLLFAFRLARLWWDRHPGATTRALMILRALPVVAGISNVNLTGSWAEKTPRTLDYLRVSPTGPLLPLVFTLTTLGPRLSICVTYRRTIFSPDTVRAIARGFLDRLEIVRKIPL
jgi:hypothetical protein